MRGFIFGEGGEFGEVGNAFVEVSAFIVTMNCSFKASYLGLAAVSEDTCCWRGFGAVRLIDRRACCSARRSLLRVLVKGTR